jgi:hypothetical protein
MYLDRVLHISLLFVVHLERLRYLATLWNRTKYSFREYENSIRDTMSKSFECV